VQAIDDLQHLFHEVFSGEIVSDSTSLYKFAAGTARVFRDTRGPARVGAFALSGVYLSLAQAIEGEPLDAARAGELYRSLYAPSKALLDELAGSADESRLLAAVLALLDAHAPPPDMQ